ncbi:MAG TPA: hypothetical protein VNK89_09265 [Thermoflexus sp.]|nr:hypothetical protein [Thermoflexus sp.]
MTNEEMARADLAQAEEILREAGRLDQRQAWNLVVRWSQEAEEDARTSLDEAAWVLRRCREAVS